MIAHECNAVLSAAFVARDFTCNYRARRCSRMIDDDDDDDVADDGRHCSLMTNCSRVVFVYRQNYEWEFGVHASITQCYFLHSLCSMFRVCLSQLYRRPRSIHEPIPSPTGTVAQKNRLNVK